MQSIGVVLLNLGGPEREEEISPFLRSMLSDPDVTGLPWPVRPLFARAISAVRAKRVAERYRIIGGGSPIGEQTRLQVEALREELGHPFLIRHAFRHTAPRAVRVISELAASGVDRVVALPAYPQHSRSTTESAMKDLARAAESHSIEVIQTESFPDAAGYIEAMISNTIPLLDESAHVIITAHGLPKRMVLNGDPYVEEVERTVAAVSSLLPPGTPHSLAFQSRLGPVEWTRPYLTDEIFRLAGAGVDSLVLLPISFAAECLETSYELAIEVALVAKEAGISSYRVAPAPGSHPAFISELARLVRKAARTAEWLAPHAG